MYKTIPENECKYLDRLFDVEEEGKQLDKIRHSFNPPLGDREDPIDIRFEEDCVAWYEKQQSVIKQLKEVRNNV